MANVAVIGLGNMGGPMAARLVQADHNVTGYDQSADAAENARSVGVEISPDIAAAVADADVVVTMLPSGVVVDAVLTGAGGVLEHLPPGRLVIDSSTIDVHTSRQMHTAVADAGHRFLDAPVSGGMTGAQAGTLTFMVGGEESVVEEARPLLSAMGSRVVHAGRAGAGAAAKIVNNMLLGISLAGVCEAFTLADELGLAADVFYDIASTSSGDCWALRTWTPVPGIVPGTPSENGWTPGFSTALMLKDLNLARTAASAHGVKLEAAGTVSDLFERHAQAGYADLDCSSLIELAREERR